MRPWSLPAAAGPRALAVAGGGALALLAAAAAGELGRGAALATGLCGLAIALLAWRGAGQPAGAAPELRVAERHALGRDAGVALLATGERRLVVGYGAAGVTLVAELPPARPAGPGDRT
ncbi:flagellar biosynthetic protein FliO [Anaeromyxobacter diazotrophicus]|uniref:Flagellar biosynthesis protein FliO n=1 Tax=Anaeromyxobacter diazotrophicus TaxID=2590199 RepID=A0A7I9VGQ6_9BACT|nr:flagellar biosynthetic protein FliO [Anaeromyxobacter diazotrophicus]GEJ55574.1 hypothetical protein AMYX_03150 [Anaeromyxobacter diazotrophicus]